MNDRPAKPPTCRGGSSCALLILAAGASTRLGRPKQLLLFRGHTLLRHAAETALESVCRPVVAALGASADRIRGELNGLPVTVALNAQWNEGIGSSIRAGLAALAPSPPRAVVIMLCDQPLVPAQFLDRLVAVHLSTGKGIVAAEYGDGVGVPALFDRAYFPDLAALRGSQGAKPLLFKYASHLGRIPLPEAAFDVDREEDMRRLEQLNGGCSPPAVGIVQ